MVLMFTTVSIQSFEHSKRKSNIQQLSVIIKLDVKSTVGKVGVLQRGQKTPGVEQEHFHSESPSAKPPTHAFSPRNSLRKHRPSVGSNRCCVPVQ